MKKYILLSLILFMIIPLSLALSDDFTDSGWTSQSGKVGVKGVRVIPTENITITNFWQPTCSSSTMFYICGSADPSCSSSLFSCSLNSSEACVVDYNLTEQTTYYLAVDNGGGSYTSCYQSPVTYPFLKQSGLINYTGRTNEGTPDTAGVIDNIRKIEVISLSPVTEVNVTIDNSTWNFSSAINANNQTGWRTNQTDTLITKDQSPTFIFNTNKDAYCAVTTRDVNFTECITDGTDCYNSSEGLGSTHTATYGTNLAFDNHTLYISCVDSTLTDVNNISTTPWGLNINIQKDLNCLNLTIIQEPIYQPNWSNQINWTNLFNSTVIESGNYTITFTEEDIPVYNFTEEAFLNATNACGSDKEFGLYTQEESYWTVLNLTNGSAYYNINSTVNWVSNLSDGQSMLFNLTNLSLINAFQNYTNWTLTENRAYWNFTYLYDIR